MTSSAKKNFDNHIKQAYEAIEIYKHLKRSGYSADFGLRFVWVASVSALDHYISEIIIEKSTEHFANNKKLSSKILNEGVPLQATMRLHNASPTQAIVEFRSIIDKTVRFRTFQKANDVSDGLSFIWDEQHKWNKISRELGIKNSTAKHKLNSIGYRRDSIVHNADYDNSTCLIRPCDPDDAFEALSYINQLVDTIEFLVP